MLHGCARLNQRNLYKSVHLDYTYGMERATNKRIIPQEVKNLGKLFTDAGFEIRTIGGWVRDMLRGVAPKDLDLATTATPEQMMALCNQHSVHYFETGLQHGTISIVGDAGTIYEVTTLRIDTATDGRHATVEYTTDWQVDAERRDFTINAMSVDLDGTLFDYFNGREHLNANKVIFVGDAEARIQEDYLRILRFFRFRSRMSDRSYDDRQVFEVIARNAPGLEQISAERVWMEMAKILSGSETMLCMVLTDMFEWGVLEHIGLPKVGSYDIINAAIVRAQTANPLTVLAALTGTKMADAWKMSRDEKKLLEFLQSYCCVPRPGLAFFKEIAVDHGHEYAVECASLFGPSETLEATRNWVPSHFPVGGEDLIARGVKPGPEMGQILNRLKRVWMDSDYRLDKDALLAIGDEKWSSVGVTKIAKAE